ncbi:16S rRNA (adenine(1518)-N(6)/adenine(1519)-N(6))-dimethyltransferase RsmA [Bosea sp. (in: a-proteobacteria)]|uniref:16S rRNA (adenine(1518)-N(6)/adenine(1519)-N(6))- dimethyltransferase RsmA n=1 Tax=Bosea sp. (in: a-proteobacteria) TaxID=1871050 RepID=UPI00121AA45A|nr:16S rRNA (adenine(1518)-N(6)/adenine(1519)-N(6))-dimethyltransferase RsmA [Bosea sp. (in: a-proteobacteria)]TAJ33696.1 MAG: 16S rRNA (adenine(1518)-N(6)/adenine(1519)-N(6))-dimethyltransferase RsmA [Bosea sp. (in: a-proteobacteria)]
MSQIDTLPPLREVVERHGLMAQKSLGQNFLFDLNLTSRIARSSGLREGETVVEIGPGPGGLTRALLAAGAGKVIAIERDRRCMPALAEIAAHYPGRLEVIDGDALAVDLAPRLDGGKARIIANLPYNIGTPLLVGWLSLEPWPSWWRSLTLMFQREVAERIVATPEERADYGRLAVLANWRCETRILFDVPRNAFVPPPKITSSVVQLVPRENPEPCDRRLLERVTLAAFGQRRKMLRQSLKAVTPEPGGIIAAAGLDETARAEEVPVSGFVRLANALAAAPRP